MKWLSNIANQLLPDQLISPESQRLFSHALYAWLLLYALHTIPLMDVIYGDQSVMMPRVPRQSGVLGNILYSLNYERSRGFIVLGIHALACALAMFQKGGLPVRFLVFFTGWMLYYGCIPSFNGAYLLALSFSAFAMAMVPTSRKPLQIDLSNLGFLAVRLQLILVYFISAFYKLQGEAWLDGTALYQTLQIDAFSNPRLSSMLLGSVGLLKFMTIASLAYQTLFPILVWIKKIKGPFLAIGVIFHLGIGLTLNLWDFATIMLIGYIAFINAPITWILNRIPAFRKAPR